MLFSNVWKELPNFLPPPSTLKTEGASSSKFLPIEQDATIWRVNTQYCCENKKTQSISNSIQKQWD